MPPPLEWLLAVSPAFGVPAPLMTALLAWALRLPGGHKSEDGPGPKRPIPEVQIAPTFRRTV